MIVGRFGINWPLVGKGVFFCLRLRKKEYGKQVFLSRNLDLAE